MVHLLMCSQLAGVGKVLEYYILQNCTEQSFLYPAKKKKNVFICYYHKNAGWKPDFQDTSTVYYIYQEAIQIYVYKINKL